MSVSPAQLAAIDLGSNSFHMIVARSDGGGRFTVLDRIKESVRLAAGVDEDGNLSHQAAARALKCLSRFHERIANLPPENVRVVGTNTLRSVRNGMDFVALASATLGHRIEIISGTEEARLIFAGANHTFDVPGRRLITDIGGGSTELILGTPQTPQRLSSVYMGCVSWSNRFFVDGHITEQRMADAITAARQQIGGIMRAYRDDGWEHALGSSGTIKAISATLAARGDITDGITRDALERLAAEMARQQHIDAVHLPAVSDQRRPVLAGGTAILVALFRSLRISRMQWVNGALKEGLMLRMLGERERQEDMRGITVNRLADRLQIDRTHAERVRCSARHLLTQVASDWNLNHEHASLLEWAAQLHEIGQFLSYTGYHKHSAYLLANSDMPGFSRQQQQALAAIVLCHRGQLTWPRLRQHLPGAAHTLLRLAILLRLATTHHRTRSVTTPPMTLTAAPDRLTVQYPAAWLEEHPLMLADLSDLSDAMLRVGYILTVR